MPNAYPNDLIQQAQEAVQAMQHIDPGFKVGDISLAALQNATGLATANQATISSLETQLTNLRNERAVVNTALWDTLKRLRAGVKAAYGDDSSQYEMIGGTRMSEKKKPAKKAPQEAPSA